MARRDRGVSAENQVPGDMEAKMAGMRTCPPKISVGPGGPSPTPIAHDLRALRETAMNERFSLRKGKMKLGFSELDRERRITELSAHIKFLSEQIREVERAD